jgi:hypothetical protein
MKRGRRYGLVASVAGALCLFSGLSGVGFASPAGGVRGDPQPELTPFSLGTLASTSTAAIAMEPNGSMVVAYDVPAGSGKLLVCVLDRGLRRCASKTVLNLPSGQSPYGPPGVFIPSANHVFAFQGESPGAEALYSSTDGGKVFGRPVQVGSYPDTLSVSASALVGSHIVFIADDNGGGAQIESISLASPGSSPITTLTTKTAYDVAVGNYRDGALVGSDYDGAAFTSTYAWYAPAGSNFNATSSYTQFGPFGKEMLLGISGDALLTVQTAGSKFMLLRIFNGRGFGPAHVVPGGTGCIIGCSITVDEDPGGAVHVFIERSEFDYDLIERTTTSGGKNWDAAVNLGDAISDGGFAAALDSRGAGLVIGTGNVLAYPVLAAQGVSFGIKPSGIRQGKSATGSGKISPAGAGRVVTLQVERSGRWYSVATTHSRSGGSFSFTIRGGSAGTFDYRAVASDLAGYLMYGYSNSQSLHVTG